MSGTVDIALARELRGRGYTLKQIGDVMGVTPQSVFRAIGKRPATPSKMDRFLEKVRMTHTCWIWVGAHGSRGYGRLWDVDRVRNAHILAYEWFIGPVPAGLELDHLCRNPKCVNPHHLDPVTHQENCRRGDAGAYNKAKTHCPQGHAYDAANTYVDERGGRWCKTCRRESQARYRARKLAA